ncbi:hypothetical protein CCR75_006453 [Bremia lactucae]|uniref:RWP-RK domain-containing protein n=1 Tax=Bremia lactucae TaxID=4779 RepID=A0A976FMS8_BRELC|nr:hypothetical protein CCR75_006453 [Bremia lactucae]
MKPVTICRPKSKKLRKSRRVYDFDYKFLSQYFHMPQKQAAALLDVAVITIKRNCKHYGFKWPYRANKYKYPSRPVLSDKGRAFHELPLNCMKEQIDAEMHQTSECDTDTESVDEGGQEKENYCNILCRLRASSTSEMSMVD